ncbi:ABC transporter ATP-binding protein [Longivirga aurantiaca]|uniref:ABC transporter ATP-binding protein n=1 Tax=Longivirga aurantiaca TaxID=1837743 RepID=A0ABW1T027_9ACTN
MTPDAPAALETRGLEVSFRGRGSGAAARAVDGVDLVLGRGEIVALVGESGCGKTTLARTILALQKSTAGDVLVDGERLGTSSKALKAYRRRVQLVLQDPTGALNPRHTVYEAVAEGLRIHGLVEAEEKRVAQALSLAGLRPPERFFLRYPHELSGGQRQRVVIAGALALEPDIIVADEPVSSLDASVRGEILALLLRLREELGLSLLVVTHDLGLAWNIADRVAVMYLGRIVEQGPTEELLRDPKHPYTRALLSVVPETERLEQVVLTGEPPDPTRIPAGCRFHPRCPVVASGEAARLGIEDACRGTALPVLPASGAHAAACHLPGSASAATS